jgi:soluble lytic murein transglycosylase
MRFVGLLLATLPLMGCISCARHEASSAGPSDAGLLGVATKSTAEGDAATVAHAPVNLAHWVEAVRMERWDDAWQELEALPEADKQAPEVRYVRGRVALFRGDAKSALPLLDGLESPLPLLAEDIARHRAEAKLTVGPFREAGDYFVARLQPSSLLRASEAYEKGEAFAQSRTACDKVVAHEKRSRAQEAEARARRVRLHQRTPAEDAADARWMVIEAADLGWAKDAEATLAKLDPAHPLTAQEWMRRAHVLGEANATDEALRSLERVPAAKGPAIPNVDRIRTKGEILMHARTRGTEAAKAFDECAALGGTHAPECAFLAARALSRADHDDEAIERYAKVTRTWPKTPQAEQAGFYGARLLFLHAHWAKAAAALDDYLHRFPKGSERREAMRTRAISRFMLKDYKQARRLFEELAGDEPEPITSARASVAAALAALNEGDRTHALARWAEIAKTRPLSWPALVARARLEEAKAPLPPAIEAADVPATPLAPLAIKLPPPVDVLLRIGLDGDAESALRERESLITSTITGRTVEALCEAYGQLGRAKRRYQVAQQVPGATLASAPTAQTRWAWDCAYPRPYDSLVRAEETARSLPAGLVHGVMRLESSFDPDVVSPARAVGLLQLLPETALAVSRSIGVPHADALLTSPSQNVLLGARYLREVIDKFHGQVPLALAGYNGGPDNVQRWQKRMKGMPLELFVEAIPFLESRAYVARVMGNFARYAFLRGGDAAVPKVDLLYDPD